MTSFRLLQDGTSKRLLEDGTSFRLLEQDTQVEYRPRVRAIRYTGPTGVAAHIVGCARNDRFPAGAPFASPMIYFPGGGGLETSWQDGDNTNPNEAGDALRIATDRPYHLRRFVTLPTDYTWGNSAMMDRIDAMLSYAESTYGFTAPYHLVGASMGTVVALNWAVRNPTKVASVALMLGLVNLRGFTDGRLTGGTGHPNLEPPIVDPTDAQAYNGTVPTAYNPLSRASEYAGMPIKMWQSNNDSICYLSEATAFAADNDAQIVNIGDQTGGFIYGHGLNSGFRPADVSDFCAAHD